MRVERWKRRYGDGTRYITTFAVFAAIICASCAAKSGSIDKPAAEPPVRERAVYVLDASNALSVAADRVQIERLAARARIRQVVLYGLGPAIVEREAELAAWLGELRRAGIMLIAPIGGIDRLPVIAAFEARHPAVVFDAIVTEHEFWNAEGRAAAFDDFRALVTAMRKMRSEAALQGRRLRVGAYLGYPSEDEAAWITSAVDFVYLDYSVSSPARAWRHVHGRGGALRERFVRFAAAGVDVWPIFYARGEVDMAAALRADGLEAAEARFLADLEADPEARPLAARLRGFVYFGHDVIPVQ
jgi:hypothetical protein